MLQLFSRLFARQTPPPAPMPPLNVPDPVAIIGDIHGCARLLDILLDRIATLAPQATIVCVGDYIDRGDESAAVIETLMASPQITCLAGNHEAMLLGFLDDAAAKGPRWLRNGGLQTLASYGVAGPNADGTRPLDRVRDDLALAMGDARINWLRDLPKWMQTGNLLITHAGADPARAPQDQDDRDLMWGHRDFMAVPRSDGLWVAYGHVIQDAPSAAEGRIALDTGAYATGRLTAAGIHGDSVDFITT
ncbi:serine/threonine protein phosphatase 1 [Loktanella sp. DSM 29012]|nr:serine/threonine protein phosphatase 1 [Loktanella sp. DSM 29012]